MKKIIAFDLDGTLAESKSAMTDSMAELFEKLLEQKEVCIISGGKYEQFQQQALSGMNISNHLLARLHLMPTCGTRYYRYNDIKSEWVKLYSEDIPVKDRKRIIEIVHDAAKELDLLEKSPFGEIIEDRGSQITFSALGQKAPADKKHAWDPDGSKKLSLRDKVAPLIPEYEVRTGGSTSIDITKLGIDKAYGMKKLMEQTNTAMEEILFIGDALHEGGNDYPVRAMGIDSIAVENYLQTERIIETILAVT